MEYRNAIRSRAMIRNAFIQLMRKKDLGKIRTKDVIELADVSKGTFYAHYNSIFDVFREIENDYLCLMFKVFENRPSLTFEDLLPQFLSGLEEIEKDRDIFLILFSTNFGGSFNDKIKATFVEYMMSSYSLNSSFKSDDEARGYFTFVAGGALALIREWMESSDRPPSSDVAEFLNGCISYGVGILENMKR